jgi:catechol 2,3-dioxygenase-like lactoylglutathione lyase family enzyme/DNA-binding CsgD family transcriptional regulator
MQRGRGRPAHPDQLTPAEWQVLDGVRHGMTNGRIAARRATSREAVKFHLENVRGKLGIEGRAAMRRWEGIPAKSAIRRSSMTLEGTSPLSGHIGQVAIAVKEIERSVSFYRDTLGLPHLFTFGQLAFFDCDGTRLFLDALPEAQGKGNSTIYFTVSDIHAAQEALTARGVPFEGAPHMIHKHDSGVEEWMTFFRDPDGNMLSLMSQVAPA